MLHWLKIVCIQLLTNTITITHQVGGCSWRGKPCQHQILPVPQRFYCLDFGTIPNTNTADTLEEQCALWEDKWHIYPRSVLVAVSASLSSIILSPVLKGSSSIPLHILITWWCFKSTLYLLEITSDRQVCCLSAPAAALLLLDLIWTLFAAAEPEQPGQSSSHKAPALCRLPGLAPSPTALTQDTAALRGHLRRACAAPRAAPHSLPWNAGNLLCLH